MIDHAANYAIVKRTKDGQAETAAKEELCSDRGKSFIGDITEQSRSLNPVIIRKQISHSGEFDGLATVEISKFRQYDL